MVTKKLQKIVLPIDEKHQAAWHLFYHGPRFVRDLEKDTLHIGQGNVADFSSYLNGFSVQVWKRYTDLSNVKLHLKISGKAIINFIGYHMEPTHPIRHLFGSLEVDSEEIKEVEFLFPEEDIEQMYSFEIEALSDTVLYEGYYTADYREEDVKNINLALSTTTCRKEEFIIRNVKAIKEQLIAAEPELEGHFEMHVVDNGRTLSADQIEGNHVTLHPNKNTGGSGGFARGMMEAMRQKPKATHVLLMDDDVLVLPESIRRTYELLTVVKPEYEDAFISGAMLDYEAMHLQIEDIGMINSEHICCQSAKGVLDQNNLRNVLTTNEEILPVKNKYQAWWYCCIPVKVIEKQGLPLPIFIRQDDVEYGLRCKPYIISMTGICVWHMGFANKYSASMLMYQEFRNKLIARAITGSFAEYDIYDKWKKTFRWMMLSFSYNSAELLLKAMEHYLEGPSFIEQDLGEKLLKENGQLNDKMKSLLEFPEYEVKIGDVYGQEKRSLIGKVIYRITYNGHRFWPERWLKKDTKCIGYDGSYQPQRWTLHKDVLLVNVHSKTACLHELDKKKWRELMRRYKRVVRLYRNTHRQVEIDYRNRKDYILSDRFWDKYLEL